jgi:hypothetical protein
MDNTHDVRKSVFDNTFKKPDGSWGVGSWPNLPLVAWAVARVLTRFLHATPLHVAQVVAFGALFTWAWLELFQGVNYFRRLLGLVVLVLIVHSAAVVKSLS